MSTTTVRLPAELKARVAAAAKRAGTTAHHFIVEAIAEKTDRDERKAEFMAEAESRFAEIARTSETIPWAQMQRYLEARISGRKSRRPKARKLGR